MDKVERITTSYKPSQISSVINKAGWDLHFNQLYKGYCDDYNGGDHSTYTKGGWQLHEAFFEQLKPIGASQPTGAAKELIDKKFGSFSKFKEQFVEKASAFHGSGWCYLTTTGKIEIIELHEPRTNIAMIIDLWEHSYVQTHESKKSDYFKGMWSIIDWNVVSERIEPSEPEELTEGVSLRHLINFIKE